MALPIVPHRTDTPQTFSTWYPPPRHDGILVQTEDGDGLSETDPALAGWWAECLCGWETFLPRHDDAVVALDEHLAAGDAA